MAWSDTAFKIADRLLWRLWGNQTSAQATREEAIQAATWDFNEALRLGDLARANAAVDRLRELRDQAAATRTKP